MCNKTTTSLSLLALVFLVPAAIADSIGEPGRSAERVF